MLGERMKKSLSIGKYIVVENLSNKILNGFLIFSGVILLAVLALKQLTIYRSDMVLRDIGIFLIEFFIFLMTVFTSSTYLIRDHKEKSIYLILTKPVSRSEYILGNILGNIFLLIIYIFSMTLFLQIIMFISGISLCAWDIISIFFIFLKLSILASLGVFFAVISDSYITANIFTFSVYVIGHFTKDLLLISKESTSWVVKIIFQIFYYIFPRYYSLNARDFLIPVDLNYLSILTYVFFYIIIIFILTSFLFEKRKL